MIYYPKVFIIILNWNGLKDTLECLASVFRLNYPNFEVIVVDNGSTDDSVEVIKKSYPQVTLIENKENLGYTGGNNIAMQYAMDHLADYVWLLNNDTIVEPDTLSKLVTEAEKSPDIGLVSPIIYYYDMHDKIQFCGSYVDWINHVVVYPEHKNAHINDDFKSGKNVCLWGTALLIKKDVVDRIGYLNEKFFAYWEDTEYSMRSIKAGFLNVIEPSAKIYHKNQLPEINAPNKAIHYYFFMARNEYSLWLQYLRSLEKLFYFRKYLIKLMKNATGCRYCVENKIADACLDGLWSAVHGVGGPWDKNIKMPAILKKIFSRHPYFWANLLQGNISYLSSEILRRTKAKIMKIVG